MQQYLQLEPDAQRDAFNETANQVGLPAYVIEKDFWVCYLLDALFNQINIDMDLLFKGGTSLFKCYDLIHRFSEDIDISLDRHHLGFTEDVANLSNTKTEKLLDDLQARSIEWIRATLAPALEQQLSGTSGELIVDEQNPEDIVYAYPRVLDENDYPTVIYVKPSVLIETGTRAGYEPNEKKVITPFVASTFPQLFAQTEYNVTALSPARTFWEKVTAVHAFNSRGRADKVADRQSRHLYDIYQIVSSPEFKDVALDIDLLREVAEHKRRFFRAGHAKYGEAAAGDVNLVPVDDMRDAFAEDYARMSDLFFDNSSPPSFDELMATLETIQSTVRQQTTP